MHQALRVVVEDDDDDQHDGRQAAGSKVPPLHRQPSSAPLRPPTPPEGTPGSSWWRG
jgi:hypothetical protein